MTKTKKSMTSVLVVLGMLTGTVTPFGSVLAAENTQSFEPDYSAITSIPGGWSGSGFTIMDGDMPAFYGSGYNGETAKLIYNDAQWSGNIDYTWKYAEYYTGTASMYFFYNDENNYYALEMDGNGSSIIKKVNGLETVLDTDSNTFADFDGVSVRVTYDDNGKISVYKGSAGTVPSDILYEVTDSASPSGKIGIGFSEGEGYMYGLKVSGTAADGSEAPKPEYEKVEASYALTNGATLPDGWSGDTANVATLGNWAYQHSSTAWGKNTVVVYDEIDWTGDFSLTSRVNNNGSTAGKSAYLYFYYTDSNNYYALQLGNDEATGINLIKCVNGTKTVIAESENYAKPQSGTWFTINVSEANKISVTAHANNSTDTVTHFSDVSDSTFTHGKIGFGWDGDSAWFAEYSANGYNRVKTETPTEEPTKEPGTGGSTSTEFKEVYAENFDAITDAEMAKWSTISGDYITVNNGVLCQSQTYSGLNAVKYTGYTTSGTYKLKASISNNNGGQSENYGMILFNMTSQNKGYCLIEKGGSSGEFVLGYIGDGGFWNPVTIASVTTDSAKNSTVDYEILYEEGGYITVDATYNGKTTRLFDRVQDTKYTGGNVGALFRYSEYWFDNYSISVPSEVEATETPTQTPGTGGGASTEYKEVYAENFDAITDAEMAKWSTIFGDYITVNNGVLCQSQTYSGLNAVKYTGYTTSGTYKLKASISNNNGGQSENYGMILFNMTSQNKGYCLIEKGGSSGEFVLGYIGDGGFWNPVTIESVTADSAMYSTVDYEILYEEGGYITVDATYNGKTTRLFDRVHDTKYTGGNVGALFRYSEYWFDNYSISVPSEVEATETPTEAPEITTGNVHFEPSYDGTALPAGWSGNGFSMANGSSQSWPAFVGNAYAGKSSTIVYDGYIWEKNVDYTWKQLNGYSGEARLYFFYEDASNYYSFNLSASGTKVVKVKDGVETVLNSDESKLVNIGGNVSVRVAYAQDGTITAYADQSAGIPSTVLYTAKDTATTAPKGKIGIGFENGGGHVCYLVVKGTATNVIIEEPEATPTPTPTPTPEELPPEIASDTVYSGASIDDWSGDGFTVGSWGNYQFNAANGKLILDKYVWKNALSYSVTQVSVNGNGCEGMLYFMYQDDSNYYVLKMTDLGGEVAKVEGGSYTVLASTTEKMKDFQYSLRIVREANGVISIWTGAKDSTTQTTKLMETEPDTTFNEGKIGMGYTNRPNGTQWFVSPSVKGTTGNTEDVIPLETVQAVSVPTDALSYKANDSKSVRKLGRAYDMNNAVNLTWSLSGIEFMVYNTDAVYVNFKNNAIFGVSIDDGPIEHIKLSGFDTAGYAKIASFDSVSDHKIRIIKETDQNSTIVVSDIKLTGNAPSIKAANERTRKIEFVGDSITVGACMFKDGSANARMGTNALINYAGQTGMYFGADMSMTAVGGSGFTGDENDSLSTFKYYDYKIQPNALTGDEYKWDFSQYVPDVVVVNIGTNGGVKNTKDLYIKFYNQIRERYNDTNNEIKILFALGAINQDAWPNLHEAYTELKKTDSNVYELQLGTGYVAGVAAHPDLEQQTKMANVLINYLKEIMPGWDMADISAGAFKKSGSSVTVPYRVYANDADLSGDVMTAVYDTDGVLIGIEKASATLNAENNSVSGTATITNAEKAATAKIFMWNGNNKPLAVTETAEF